MNKDDELVYLIERNHEAYLTWVALWLASIIGIVTILVSVISVQVTLSLNHLVLVWSLYWGSVSGMIFSVSRLITSAKQNLSWSLNLKDYKTIRDEAKKRRGLAGYFVYIKNENTEDERAETRESGRILTYLAHLIFAGIFIGLAVGKPCWVIVTVLIIFVVSILLTYSGRDAEKKTDKK